MIAIKGIYDGKNVIPLESLPENKKYKVLITLLEEFDNEEEIRNFFRSRGWCCFIHQPQQCPNEDRRKKEMNYLIFIAHNAKVNKFIP